MQPGRCIVLYDRRGQGGDIISFCACISRDFLLGAFKSSSIDPTWSNLQLNKCNFIISRFSTHKGGGVTVLRLNLFLGVTCVLVEDSFMSCLLKL